MKRKLFIETIIPIVATFAVIGSGFSLWIFDDSYSSQISSDISINTIDALTAGNVLVYGNSKTNLNKGTYINFDQSTYDNQGNLTQNGLSFKNHTGNYRTGAYYLWTYTQTLANTINNTSSIYEKTGSIDVKSYNETPYEEIGVTTDIVFTTTLKLPKELGQYLTLTYKGNEFKSEEVSIDTGSIKVSYGDWSSTYIIKEKLSLLNPSTRELAELFPKTKDSAINHEYSSSAYGLGDLSSVKFGYNFFDWSNMDISYYTGEDDSWHKKEPSSIKEYKEMINALSNCEGKAENEQANGRCAIGASYQAEVITL